MASMTGVGTWVPPGASKCASPARSAGKSERMRATSRAARGTYQSVGSNGRRAAEA